MLCAQVLGNDVAINIGGASNDFGLNVFRPMVIHNFLQSVRLLADGMAASARICAVGIEPNQARINDLVEQSLMLVTALNPTSATTRRLSYQKAHKESTSLRAAAVASGM